MIHESRHAPQQLVSTTSFMVHDFRKRILALPRYWKRAILVCFDVLTLSGAMYASYGLRYDNWYVPNTLDQWAIIVSAPMIAVPIFVRMGLYRAVVRYLPERAILTIAQAMIMATVAWVVLVFLSEMAGRGVVPRSVPILYMALGTFVVGGSRFAAKLVFWPIASRRSMDRPAIVIYGAGDAGMQLASSLRSSRFIAGFLDDNPSLHRRDVAGIRVYPPSQLPELVREYGVDDVILSIPSLTPTRRKEIVSSIGGRGLTIRSLPAIGDLVTGKYLVGQIKEIEVDDLLGRSSVPPDTELIRDMIVGRTIMVTGAGGSIGSELCRKIARWSPQRLVLFEANEFALYNIERELAALKEITTVPVLGSVIDAQRVRQAIRHHDVKVVFHAAAHKHVPLVEANVMEGARNNVFGTKTLVDVAYEAGVEHFVLISTDKAVRPTNVMGATKRWAELIVREKALEAAASGSGQLFSAVRFGNVLGSNGSVVPLFKEQIAHGGPVTLTDPGMTRYFMSIQEAAELIVQSGALAEGGDVFLLDMGEPMLISELAENMVRLGGLTVRNSKNPTGDIEIVVTGKRPGEKMYEELFYDPTSAQTTKHKKILRAPSQSAVINMAPALAELKAALDDDDEQRVRSVLFALVAKSE
jgi:FlaA1/EpsC-like NDP-sugar epimerase